MERQTRVSEAVGRSPKQVIPNIEDLVASDHRYRAILALFNWSDLCKPLRNCYSQQGRKGYAVEQGFRCLFLQFLEDKSDRQMEEFLKYDLAAKYFCCFGLTEARQQSCWA